MISIKATSSALNKFDICEHPGYFGIFTTNQAAGALPNGTRIAKIDSDAGDEYTDGAMGTILGSIYYPWTIMGVNHFYFIEWDAHPKCAIAIMDIRIKPIQFHLIDEIGDENNTSYP